MGVAIKTCYYTHKSYFYKSDLSPRQFILLINCMLGCSIYRVSDTVITVKPSGLKSRFIYHFMIAHYPEELSFDRVSMEKL